MTESAHVSVRVTAAALARLDSMAAARGLSRSGALRALLEGGLPAQAPADVSEALSLLSESARSGSVPARIALARLLTAKPARDPVQARRDELMERRRARSA